MTLCKYHKILNTLLRLYIQKQCLFNTLCVVGKILKQQTTFSMKEKEVCFVRVSQTVQYLYLYWLQIAESILYVPFKNVQSWDQISKFCKNIIFVFEFGLDYVKYLFWNNNNKKSQLCHRCLIDLYWITFVLSICF